MDFTIDDTTAALAALVRDMGEQLVTDESLRELDARFGPGTESGGTDKDSARFHARYWDELVRAGVPAALAPERPGGAGRRTRPRRGRSPTARVSRRGTGHGRGSGHRARRPAA